MAPKKNKAVAKKTAASTKKAVKAPKPAVAKKTAASTKKAIKATQLLQMKSLNGTRQPKIRRLNKLLQKYSPISTLIKRDLLIGRF